MNATDTSSATTEENTIFTDPTPTDRFDSERLGGLLSGEAPDPAPGDVAVHGIARAINFLKKHRQGLGPAVKQEIINAAVEGRFPEIAPDSQPTKRSEHRKAFETSSRTYTQSNERFRLAAKKQSLLSAYGVDDESYKSIRKQPGGRQTIRKINALNRKIAAIDKARGYDPPVAPAKDTGVKWAQKAGTYEVELSAEDIARQEENRKRHELSRKYISGANKLKVSRIDETANRRDSKLPETEELPAEFDHYFDKAELAKLRAHIDRIAAKEDRVTENAIKEQHLDRRKHRQPPLTPAEEAQIRHDYAQNVIDEYIDINTPAKYRNTLEVALRKAIEELPDIQAEHAKQDAELEQYAEYLEPGTVLQFRQDFFDKRTGTVDRRAHTIRNHLDAQIATGELNKNQWTAEKVSETARKQAEAEVTNELITHYFFDRRPSELTENDKVPKAVMTELNHLLGMPIDELRELAGLPPIDHDGDDTEEQPEPETKTEPATEPSRPAGDPSTERPGPSKSKAKARPSSTYKPPKSPFGSPFDGLFTDDTTVHFRKPGAKPGPEDFAGINVDDLLNNMFGSAFGGAFNFGGASRRSERQAKQRTSTHQEAGPTISAEAPISESTANDVKSDYENLVASRGKDQKPLNEVQAWATLTRNYDATASVNPSETTSEKHRYAINQLQEARQKAKAARATATTTEQTAEPTETPNS